jgi:protein tyrosine phosphatase
MANPFPRIWVGSGERLTRDLMNTYSFTHILNCADESACPYNIKAGLTSNNYTCINAIDSTDVDLFGTWYPIFKETLDRYLRDTTCKNVFVHCQAGINRSATLTAGYVIKRFRVPLQTCLSKMISQRPCILTNPAFQEQLVQFVKKSD